MLWITCQNFSQIERLTNWEMQFYENCTNQKNRSRLATRSSRPVKLD